MAPWIISHFPEHRIYVEPFAGGANVLLRKERVYSEVINDLDGDVVNLFKVLRDPASAKDLTKALRLTPYAREEFDLACDRENCDDMTEKARRFMVRCWMSYSGRIQRGQGFRANTSRSYTTPAHDWANLPGYVAAVSERLRGVVIECRPALEVIAGYCDRPEALVYCDPPYVRSTRTSIRWKSEKAYTHEMSDDDHRAFAEAVKQIRAMVIVSGYRSDLYDELFEGWTRIDQIVSASGQQGSVSREESLWLSPSVTNKNMSLFAF